LVASTGLKYAIGRARPDSGEEKNQFNPGESDDKWGSFPSRHTAVMWAAITPYAKEYGMEWLYGLAAVTNAARTGSREHWFSDTVAGSVLGYALGHLAWDARRGKNKNAPTVAVGPGNVALVWDLQ
jgi:membrane-associated phospholipid phosphatase